MILSVHLSLFLKKKEAGIVTCPCWVDPSRQHSVLRFRVHPTMTYEAVVQTKVFIDVWSFFVELG